MEWTQALFIVFGNIAFILPLWLWNRAEARNDLRQMDNKLETWRIETNAILVAIQQEMKDFHGRLCAIEERNKGK
jgi:hypothetical protein